MKQFVLLALMATSQAIRIPPRNELAINPVTGTWEYDDFDMVTGPAKHLAAKTENTLIFDTKPQQPKVLAQKPAPVVKK